MENAFIKKSVYKSFMILFIMLASCQTEEVTRVEALKNIEGSWKIVSASRNGTDLTDRIDFSQFRLNFIDNSTYTIENKLPFLISKNGTWSLDDPAYPFVITFTGEGSETPVSTNFDYPVVEGNRQINLKFSPGCSANSYQYTFEKVSE